MNNLPVAWLFGAGFPAAACILTVMIDPSQCRFLLLLLVCCFHCKLKEKLLFSLLSSSGVHCVDEAGLLLQSWHLQQPLLHSMTVGIVKFCCCQITLWWLTQRLNMVPRSCKSGDSSWASHKLLQHGDDKNVCMLRGMCSTVREYILVASRDVYQWAFIAVHFLRS